MQSYKKNSEIQADFSLKQLKSSIIFQMLKYKKKITHYSPKFTLRIICFKSKIGKNIENQTNT